MHLLPLLTLTTLLTIPAAGTAQRTYVVDVQNRPGTHFTSLDAAFAAVQHRDVVLVRGNPEGVPAPVAPLTKGIALMGYPGPYVGGGFGSEAGPVTGTLRVRGIPVGERVQVKSLAGRASPGSPGKGAYVFESCAGQVLIDAVSIGAEFHDCADVSVCRQSFIYNVKVTRSRLVLSHSYVRGLYPSPAMIAASSEVVVGGNSTITGSGGVLDTNTCRIVQPGGVAVLASESTFFIGRYSVVHGGGIYSPFPAPCNLVTYEAALRATSANGGTVFLDSEATLGRTEGQFQVSARAIPSLSGYVGSPGEPENEFLVLTESVAGARFWLFASLPGAKVSLGLAGLGATWLDPATLLYLGTWTLDANGQHFLRGRFAPLPNAVPILIQAFVAGPSGFEISAPLMFVYQHGLR